MVQEYIDKSELVVSKLAELKNKRQIGKDIKVFNQKAKNNSNPINFIAQIISQSKMYIIQLTKQGIKSTSDFKVVDLENCDLKEVSEIDLFNAKKYIIAKNGVQELISAKTRQIRVQSEGKVKGLSLNLVSKSKDLLGEFSFDLKSSKFASLSTTKFDADNLVKIEKDYFCTDGTIKVAENCEKVDFAKLYHCVGKQPSCAGLFIVGEYNGKQLVVCFKDEENISLLYNQEVYNLPKVSDFSKVEDDMVINGLDGAYNFKLNKDLCVDVKKNEYLYGQAQVSIKIDVLGEILLNNCKYLYIL